MIHYKKRLKVISTMKHKMFTLPNKVGGEGNIFVHYVCTCNSKNPFLFGDMENMGEFQTITSHLCENKEGIF